jgi:hypothetical protein
MPLSVETMLLASACSVIVWLEGLPQAMTTATNHRGNERVREETLRRRVKVVRQYSVAHFASVTVLCRRWGETMEEMLSGADRRAARR